MEVNALTPMLGCTMRAVSADADEMIFDAEEGTRFRFYHEQDCCETVSIEDVIGDIDDLVGSPMLVAEQVSNLSPGQEALERLQDPDPSPKDESFTWTFYRFATAKGMVTVRWYGSSNGYYSEGVNFEVIEKGAN